MKKYLFPILAAAVMVGCKKETKTITKTDPVTGKTTTVEVPVEPASEQKMAIYDSAGVYHYRLMLEPGQTYPFVTVQKDVTAATMPDGKTMNMTQESTDALEFKVNSAANGVYDIDLNFLYKKTSQNGNGLSQTVDTRAAAPKEEGLKNRWAIDRTLTGNTLKMKLKQNGTIVSLTGFEPIYQKMTDAVNGLTKDANMRKQVIGQMKASFSEEIIRKQFAKNLSILPKKGVKLGESWTNAENTTPDGKVKLTSTYTLKSVDGNSAVVVVNGGIPAQNEKNTQNGITQSLNATLKQSGTLTFDAKTGWFRNQNLTVNTSQKQTFSDGKQSQTMSTTGTTTIQVNPGK